MHKKTVGRFEHTRNNVCPTEATMVCLNTPDRGAAAAITSTRTHASSSGAGGATETAGILYVVAACVCTLFFCVCV